MADKLIMVESRIGYAIQWYLEDGGDLGATLGEGETHQSLCKMDREFESGKTDKYSLEHNVATLAAWKHEGMQHNYDEGFYWESKTGATQALRLAKIAVKELRDNKPWPDWAKQAMAHGWKVPKGWKP